MYTPTDDGQWVDEQFERLARVVKDYDPGYALYWIPPAQRETLQEKQKPYVVVDERTGLPIMWASRTDTPDKILEELFLGDNTKGDVLARMEAHNAAVEALAMKEKMDVAEERQEYIAWLIGTKKNYIMLPGGRKVDDQLRPIL